MPVATLEEKAVATQPQAPSRGSDNIEVVVPVTLIVTYVDKVPIPGLGGPCLSLVGQTVKQAVAAEKSSWESRGYLLSLQTVGYVGTEEVNIHSSERVLRSGDKLVLVDP